MWTRAWIRARSYIGSQIVLTALEGPAMLWCWDEEGVWRCYGNRLAAGLVCEFCFFNKREDRAGGVWLG